MIALIKKERHYIDSSISSCIDEILYDEPEVNKAWRVLGKHIIRVTRTRYGKNKKPNRNRLELTVTVCKPNYAERRKLKTMKSNFKD